jgi:hypothetical protein
MEDLHDVAKWITEDVISPHRDWERDPRTAAQLAGGRVRKAGQLRKGRGAASIAAPSLPMMNRAAHRQRNPAFMRNLCQGTRRDRGAFE